jgi:GT2 family glycosyltransferase
VGIDSPGICTEREKVKYVLNIKYENTISLKTYLINYFNLQRFAIQFIEISPEETLTIKFLNKILYLLSKIYLRFNKSLMAYFVLARNDCKFLIDPKLFNTLEGDQKILLYGDSIVQTLNKDWYESRPKFSRTHFRSQDYIGDLVLSNFEFKSFSEIRELSSQGCLELEKIDNAISKRYSNQHNNLNVPILVDQISKFLTTNKEINEEISISILIPTDFKKTKTYGIEKCILSLIRITTKIEVEIIVLYNKNKRPEFNSMIKELKGESNLKSIEYIEDFNFSKVINAGIDASSSEYILIMNDDVILDEKSDLIHFFSHLNADQKVGSIGIRLFDETGRILHAGLEYRHGEPQHFLKGSDKDFLKNSHDICREISGCTGAFLAFRKTNFNEVGKMNENFPLDYNDVDLMLKMEKHGLKNLICSKVTATHAESLTRGTTDLEVINNDLNRLIDIHGKLAEKDPFLYTPADRIFYEKN